MIPIEAMAVVEVVVIGGIETTRTMCTVIPLAALLLPGVVVQSLLGSFFAFILGGRQVRIPELDNYRVIDGGWEDNVLVLIGELSGRYSRWVFTISPTSYSYRVIQDIAYLGVNFTVLTNGMVVMLLEDSVELSRGNKTTVIDRAIAGKLYHDSIGAIVEQGGRFYRLN